MPVLKFRDVISRIAVPVVSEPVPAVVGTAERQFGGIVEGEGGCMYLRLRDGVSLRLEALCRLGH